MRVSEKHLLLLLQYKAIMYAILGANGCPNEWITNILADSKEYIENQVGKDLAEILIEGDLDNGTNSKVD